MLAVSILLQLAGRNALSITNHPRNQWIAEVFPQRQKDIEIQACAEIGTPAGSFVSIRRPETPTGYARSTCPARETGNPGNGAVVLSNRPLRARRLLKAENLIRVSETPWRP